MDYKISENQLRSLNSLAHTIEQKLLEMQITIAAHRQRLRFVHIHYVDYFSENEFKNIENAIEVMYDLLESFCAEFNLQLEPANLRNELLIKANFLWEDLSAASVKNLKGHGNMSEELKTDYGKKINQMIDNVNNLINQFN